MPSSHPSQPPSRVRRRWRRPLLRLLLRFGLLLAVIYLCCFPNPLIPLSNLHRIRNLPSITDPDQTYAQKWITLFDRAVPPDTPAASLPEAVQQFVYQNIPYAWDWDTYGAADHWPTLDELWYIRADDCDGRAILAATLLRSRGLDVHFLSDAQHVWLSTPEGECMHPGRGRRQVDAQGVAQSNRIAGLDLLRAASFGMHVFPAGRQAIWVLAAIVLFGLHGPWWARVVGTGVLAGGYTAAAYSAGAESRDLWLLLGWAGIALWLVWAMIGTFRAGLLGRAGHSPPARTDPPAA